MPNLSNRCSSILCNPGFGNFFFFFELGSSLGSICFNSSPNFVSLSFLLLDPCWFPPISSSFGVSGSLVGSF